VLAVVLKRIWREPLMVTESPGSKPLADGFKYLTPVSARISLAARGPVAEMIPRTSASKSTVPMMLCTGSGSKNT
jgi:hypothetical protein